jgi:hypothetical protein
MAQIRSIREAIKEANCDFSDYTRVTWLPFPSPLRLPGERFQLHPGDNGVERFEYMGRPFFSEIKGEIEKRDFLNANRSLYLYGTSGGGKSHLLAALVCHLIQNGERVVYFPDCADLVENPIKGLQKALLFAFHDVHHLCTAINNASTVEDLVRFANHQPERSYYLVADQRNALDEQGDKREKKIVVSDFLSNMSTDQRYIFSASANEQSARDADRRQSKIKTLRFPAGMDQVCPYPLQTISSHIV